MAEENDSEIRVRKTTGRNRFGDNAFLIESVKDISRLTIVEHVIATAVRNNVVIVSWERKRIFIPTIWTRDIERQLANCDSSRPIVLDSIFLGSDQRRSLAKAANLVGHCAVEGF